MGNALGPVLNGKKFCKGNRSGYDSPLRWAVPPSNRRMYSSVPAAKALGQAQLETSEDPCFKSVQRSTEIDD